MEELQHSLHCTFYPLAKKPLDRRLAWSPYRFHWPLWYWLNQFISLCLSFPNQDNILIIKWYELCPWRLHTIICLWSVGFYTHTHWSRTAPHSSQGSWPLLIACRDYSLSLNHHLLAKDRLKNGTEGNYKNQHKTVLVLYCFDILQVLNLNFWRSWGRMQPSLSFTWSQLFCCHMGFSITFNYNYSKIIICVW